MNALSEMNMTNLAKTLRTHSRKWIQSDNICNAAWITYPRNVSTPTGSLPAGKCYSCEASHKIDHCPDFTSKPVRQRMIFARYKGLCLNCLRRGHFAGECKSAFRCKHCQQPHHTLLRKSLQDHADTGTGDGGDQAVKEPANVNAVATAAGDEMLSHTYSTTSKAKIALQVVLIEILSKEGRSVST